MKKILLIALGSLTIFSACKKNNDSKNTAVVDPTDADAVSTSIKVWHGERIAGNKPSPTATNSPVLDGESAGILYAFANGHVVIDPAVVSGDIAGYYLKVNGASDYFKVDYSVPLHRPLPVPASIRSHKQPFRNRPMDDPNNTDSLIIIQLPEGITPGTFCVTYSAYDFENNISNEITQCVTVEALGTANAGEWTGNWHLSAMKEVYFEDNVLMNDSSWNENLYDSIVQFPRAAADTFNRLYCYAGAVYSYSPSQSGILISGFPLECTLQSGIVSFTANGAYSSTYSNINYQVNYSSTCDNIVYDRYIDAGDGGTGGWSFDPASNKFYVVYQEEDSVNTTVAEAYDVYEKTSNSFTLKFEEFFPGYTSRQYVKYVRE